ncbi:MAG: hypothetical protein ABIA77_04240 [Candidatus Omnitrophota bacterium]
MWDIFVAFGMILLIIVLLLGGVVVVEYYQAKKEVAIFNKQFDASYTAWDFFWAGNMIKNYIRGSKMNIDLKGKEVAE